MAYLGIAPAQRNERLIPAALALMVMGLISAVDIRMLGESWPLTWLPFAVVALWPRKVGLFPSALLLFAGGLWIDWVTLGAPGQWPLVYLITYSLIRPDIRGDARGLLAGLSRFCLACLVGIPVLALTGWLVYDRWPDLAILSRGIAMAFICVPILIYFRDSLAGRMSGDD